MTATPAESETPVPSTVRTEQLLAAYRDGGARPRAARRLEFDGVGDRDVYNVSAPFTGPDGAPLLAGRVEHRDDERSETVIFTSGTDGVWRPLPGAARPALQDPFVFRYDGATHLGGVEVVEVTDAPLPGGRPTLLYRTVVLRLSDPGHPVPAFAGPWGMKDLRFAELGDGRLAVLTRPQGGADGRGRIGVTVVPSLAALSLGDVAAAPRLEALFAADEWGGVNQVTLLADGRLGLLGHVARFDAAGDRHYYPMAFELDPGTLAYTTPRLLFERADLPAGPSKRPDLADVVFPGAMVPHDDGATVYCGAGDAEAFQVDLDPVHGA